MNDATPMGMTPGESRRGELGSAESSQQDSASAQDSIRHTVSADTPVDIAEDVDRIEEEEGSGSIQRMEPGEPPGPPAQRAPTADSLSIAHVADFYKRYPGESVTFFTRVEVKQAIAGFTVRVQLPPGLSVDTYRAVDSDLMPAFETGSATPLIGGPTSGRANGIRALSRRDGQRQAHYLVWRVTEAQQAGVVHDFEVVAVVTAVMNGPLHSRAAVYSSADADGSAVSSLVDAESVTVTVRAKGAYLQHLPALYEQDDFMGRFLMLFESFWSPIDRQIDQIDNYFDPQMTPARFLPWLASWFNLELTDDWTEAQQRRLLASVLRLYRKRGTRSALQEYLEIYTENPVTIVERRAENFRLGLDARLGSGVALGSGNVPHNFEVRVRLAPMTLPERMVAELSEDEASAEIERRDLRRRRVIEGIIESQKPAHTNYVLEIQTTANQSGSGESGSGESGSGESGSGESGPAN